MNTWNPTEGYETIELLKSLNLDTTSQDRLLNETKAILSLCGNPTDKTNSETGLVFGYVQSGKTMSFTTLTALARDNGYQVVIVIAGTSINLITQSTSRLEKDLRLNDVNRKWLGVIQINTKVSTSGYVENINTALKNWKNPIFPDDEKRTILITVMKQKDNLKKLIDIFDALDKNGMPVLIIDDEGDQASLNTKARKNSIAGLEEDQLTEEDLSTIYRRIIQLKESLPHHTFVQYTATPQANLFINILDRLSPNFIQLLTPGDAYTGGQIFFVDNLNLVRPIPVEDIPEKDNLLDSPAESLIYAMQVFFLGVAAGRVTKHHDKGNRSMMVHPSRLKGDHLIFANWVRLVKDRFESTLQLSDDAFDKIELLKEFQKAYDDLKRTVKDLPEFKELLGNKAATDRLEYSISNTLIKELNSRENNNSLVKWKDHYSLILIGGQAMDRGFTVEGLTVTYMPRSIGVGNVDTIQQRARFFGYKLNYLGFCRIYLDKTTIKAYNDYIDHEQDLRRRLVNNNLSNKHLKDWEREVILENAYQLARKDVFSNELYRLNLSEWLRISAPHDLNNIIESNRKVTKEFISNIETLLIEDEGHQKRTEEQKHFVCELDLDIVFDKLIKNLKFTRDTDSQAFATLKNYILSYIEENSNKKATVYLMKKGKSRERALTKKDEIQQLFQGKNPRTGEVIYPGDSEIKNFNNLTIQIHNLNLLDKQTGEIFRNVYSLAVWIPQEMEQNIIKLGQHLSLI